MRERVSLSSYLSRSVSHVSFPHSWSLPLCFCLSSLHPCPFSFRSTCQSPSVLLSLLSISLSLFPFALTSRSLSSFHFVSFTLSVHMSLGGHLFASFGQFSGTHKEHAFSILTLLTMLVLIKNFKQHFISCFCQSVSLQ